MSHIIPAALAAKDEDYKKLGLAPGAPAFWEDGLRTGGKKGSYEWWYFDSKLDDGSSLIIVFFTGPMTGKNTDGFEPHVSIELTRADGRKYSAVVHVPYQDGCFSKETCDVRLGACYFRGDLHCYDICYKDEQVEAKVTLNGNVPAWRPHTGHIYFGEQDFFAWMPAVPEGRVEAVITQNGITEKYTGTGYHDHNWGNAPMMKLMHHWYWGRAKIGDYQIISSYIYGTKKYGYAEFPVFMLAQNGQVLADQPEKYLTYTQTDPYYDEKTHKHIYGTLAYDYCDGTQRYRVTYQREGDLTQNSMMAKMPWYKRLAARLMGLDASYNRLTGTATLERFEGDTVVERVSAPAIWELMYFGTDHP